MIADPLFENLRKLESGAAAIPRRLRAVHAPLVEARQVFAQSQSPQDELEGVESVVEERIVLQQLLERLPARAMVGLRLQGLPERGEALRALLELPDLEACQTMQQVGPRRRLALERDPSLENVGK